MSFDLVRHGAGGTGDRNARDVRDVRGLRGAALAVAALAAAVLGAASLSGATALALPGNCSQNVLTVTCTYTSGTNTFVVPKGVSTVHVVAVGARGGASAPNTVGFAAVPGGFGGRATGDLSVTPGEPLYAVVGGNGALGTGGFNGGGAGVPNISGGGGGASDVRTSQSDNGSRLIVAAGGGGGGGNGAFYAVGGTGGDGGLAGQAGTDLGGSCGGDPCFARGGSGGGAGTDAAGGSGGTGGHWADKPLLGYSGQAGDLGTGGDAVAGFEGGIGTGGGGGGGFYGGGSGGSGGSFDTATPEDGGGGGGGGGGSSLVPAGGTSGGDATGSPAVVISYTVPDSVSPSSIGFGEQAIGSSSAPRTVTLSDNGSDAIAVSSVDVIGANSGDFTISADGCSGTSVAAGGQCTVQVTFGPSATGSRFATLRFTDDAADSPQFVSLAGVGTTLGDVGVAISGPSSAANNSHDTYGITVSNAGPSTALNVVLTMDVPAGTKYEGLSTTQGSCTGPKAGSSSGTVTCSLGTIASGATAVSTVTLKITLTGRGGSIVNVARAYSAGAGATPDPNLANNVVSFSTAVTKK
jgi:uncharacterized repeat protein (TIGR01451 family)